MHIVKRVCLAVAGLMLLAPPAAAQVKISALPSASTIDGTEQLPVIQAGTTKRATVAQIALASSPHTVPVVAFAGDSNEAYGQDTTSVANTTFWNVSTFTRWLAGLARGRFRTTPAYNVAVGGIGTVHWLTVQVPQLVALKPDLVVTQIGINDVTNNVGAAAMAANVRTGVAQLTAAGISSVLVAYNPRDSHTTAQRQMLAEFNRQLWLMSRDPALNVRFVDPTPVFLDYSTGNARIGYQYSDRLHDSPVGSLAKAQVILAAIDKLLPPEPPLQSQTAELYDATLNPTGSILPNGLLIGTGGSLSNGATGTTASNWVGGLSAAGGTMTVAFSKGTDPNITNLPTQVITLGGTATNTSVTLEALLGGGYASVVPAGTPLFAQCDVRASGLSNVASVRLRVTTQSAAGAYEGMDGAQSVGPGGSAFPLPSDYYVLLTSPAVAMPAAATNLRFRIEVAPATSGAAVAGTVAISRCALRVAY